jgi:putative membrane protein
VRIVRSQIAWVNALKLQLREVKDKKIWDEQVGKFLRPEDYDYIMSKQNHVTHLGMLQGYAIKELQAHETMDIFSYIQMDDTLTRITDLQGRAERFKSTPLPRPYDYYTLAFLNIFILTFPFAFMEIFRKIDAVELIFPITVIIGWIFYQIYVFGSVMSQPFANWKTDVALDSITNTIEIDLVEAIGEKDIPEKLKPTKGFLN